MATWWIGADVGVTGALALLDNLGRIRGMMDVPHTIKEVKSSKTKSGFRKQSSYLIPEFCNQLTGLVALVPSGYSVSAVVELQRARPEQDVKTIGLLMKGEGIFLTALIDRGVPIIQVDPRKWQNALFPETSDGTKQTSIGLARKFWPGQVVQYFQKAENHHRSDAALMALWGFLTAGGTKKLRWR